MRTALMTIYLLAAAALVPPTAHAMHIMEGFCRKFMPGLVYCRCAVSCFRR